MDTIGIASIIHIIQNRLAQIIIASNTANGERDKVLLIMYGTNMLFSACWIIIYRIKTAINAFEEIQIAIAKAGIIARNGPIYGINSIIHATKAKEKCSLISTQNNLKINNQIKVKKNIDIHNKSCHLSQLDKFWIIIGSLFLR